MLSNTHRQRKAKVRLRNTSKHLLSESASGRGDKIVDAEVEEENKKERRESK